MTPPRHIFVLAGLLAALLFPVGNSFSTGDRNDTDDGLTTILSIFQTSEEPETNTSSAVNETLEQVDSFSLPTVQTPAPDGRRGGLDAIVQATDPAIPDPCPNYAPSFNSDYSYLYHSDGKWLFSDCPEGSRFYMDSCCCCQRLLRPTPASGPPQYIMTACSDYHANMFNPRGYRQLIGNRWIEKSCLPNYAFDRNACLCSRVPGDREVTPVPRGRCDDFRANSQDARRYQELENGVWRDRFCQSGLGFDPASCTCSFRIPEPPVSNNVTVGTCPNYQVFPQDIRRYQHFENGRWVPRVCPDPFGFDSRTCTCSVPIPRQVIGPTPAAVGCPGYQVIPQDVQQYRHLENNVWTTRRCSPGLGFDIGTCACTIVIPNMPGPVVTPSTGSLVSCPNYEVIPEDIQRYLYKQNGAWTVRTCPEGLGFDSSTCRCTVPLPPTTPCVTVNTCDNYQIYPQDVRRYRHLENGIWNVKTCPEGLGFDLSNCACTIIVPTLGPVPTPEPCPNYQVIPRDIQSYMYYENGRWTTRTCPQGFGYDSFTCTCSLPLPTPISRTEPCPNHQVIPEDIQRYYHLENSVWVAMTCPEGLGFDNLRTCTCSIPIPTPPTPRPPPTERCPNYELIPEDIRSYLYYENNRWTTRTCPEGLGYDSSTCSCTIRLPPRTPEPCADYQIIPQDVTRYMRMENGRWNLQVCPNGLGFDATNCSCSIRIRIPVITTPNVPCADYQVIPEDIQRYMHRENNAWVMQVCPSGFGFDSSRCSCSVRLPPPVLLPPVPCADYQVFTQDITRYMHNENGRWNMRVCPTGFGFNSDTCNCDIPIPKITPAVTTTDPCKDYQVFSQDINRYLRNEMGVWNVRTCPVGLGFDTSSCSCRIPLPPRIATIDPCENYQVVTQDVSRYMQFENGQWSMKQCPRGLGFDSSSCRCNIRLRTFEPDPCENYQLVPRDVHIYRQLENGIWNVKTCPNGFGFDTVACRCTVRLPVITPTPPTLDPCENFRVLSQDVQRYMQYVNGRWDTKSCPRGLGFDTSTCTCTIRVPIPPGQVPGRDPCEGYQAYPQDVQRYRQRENGVWNMKTCPRGIGFDSVNCTCTIIIPRLPITPAPKQDPCASYQVYPQDVRYYLHLESNQWIQRACPQGLGFDPSSCQCNFVVPLSPTTTPIPTPDPCNKIEPHPQDERSYLRFENNVWTVVECRDLYGFDRRTCRCDIYLGPNPTDPVIIANPCYGYAPYPNDVRQYLHYEGNAWVTKQCRAEYGFRNETCECSIYVGPPRPVVTPTPDPCFGYESYAQYERRYLYYENNAWTVRDCQYGYGYAPTTCRCTRYIGPPPPETTATPDPCYGYAPYPQDLRRYLYYENNAWTIRDCQANYGFDTSSCRCTVYVGPPNEPDKDPCANYQFYPGDVRRYLQYENNAWAVKTCPQPFGFDNLTCTCSQYVTTPIPTPADRCERNAVYSPDQRKYLHLENNAWALKNCRDLYGFNPVTCDCTTYVGPPPPEIVPTPDPCAGFASYPRDQRRYLQYTNNVWVVKECTYQYSYDPATCRCDIFVGPTPPEVSPTPDPCEGYVAYPPDERSYLRFVNTAWVLRQCSEPYGFNPQTCDCTLRVPPVTTSTPKPDPCADYEPYSQDQRRYLHYEDNAWAVKDCPANYGFDSRTCRCDIYVGTTPGPDRCQGYLAYSPDPRSYLYFDNNVWTLKTCTEPYGFNPTTCDCSSYIGYIPETTAPPPDECAGKAVYAGNSRQYLQYENNAWAIKNCTYQYGFNPGTCRCDNYVGPTTPTPIDPCEGYAAYAPDPRNYLHFENNVWALKTCRELYGFNPITCDCNRYIGPTTQSPTPIPDRCAEYQPYSGDRRHYLHYENNVWAVRECPNLYGYDDRTCQCDVYIGPTAPQTTVNPCEGYAPYSSNVRNYLRLENNVWGLRTCPEPYGYNPDSCDCTRYVGPTIPGPIIPTVVTPPCADYAPYARDARRYLHYENNAWAVKECTYQYGYNSSSCRCDIFLGSTTQAPLDLCDGIVAYPPDPQSYVKFENNGWALKTCQRPYGFNPRTCDCTTYISVTPQTFTTPDPCFGYEPYQLDPKYYLQYENRAWAVKECPYQYAYDSRTCRCSTFVGPTTQSPVVTPDPCSGYQTYTQDNRRYLYFENNVWVVRDCPYQYGYDSRTCRCDIYLGPTTQSPVVTPGPCSGYRPYPQDITRYMHFETNAWVMRDCPPQYGFDSSSCTCTIFVGITTPVTPQDPCFAREPYSQDITRYQQYENNQWVVKQCPTDYAYDARSCRCDIYLRTNTTPNPDQCEISRAHPQNRAQYYRLENRVWNLRSCPAGLEFDPVECSCSSDTPGTSICAQYKPFPGDQQHYYVLQNNDWVERRCPSGFAFTPSSCSCDSYIGGPPSTVPNAHLCDDCDMLHGVGYARYPGHCNLYLQCLFAGNSLAAIVARSCPTDMMWNQDTLNCDSKTNVNCPPDNRCPNVRAVEGDWTHYETFDGRNWRDENCQLGSVFNIVSCRCERGTVPSGCKPTLDLQFNQDGTTIVDSSDNRYWIENNNVTVSGGRAYFNGHAQLTVPGLSNMELGDTVFISVRFQQSFGGTVQTIAANGDCNVRPSASICAGNNMVDFYAVTSGQRSPTKLSAPFNYLLGGMQELRYELDRGVLQGAVGGRSVRQTVTGPLERVQRGFVIGGGGECDNFLGYIDELQVFLCNPNA